MKIIVTGGAGFIGTALIKHLINTRVAEWIISIDDYSSGSKENHIDNQRVRYIRAHTSEIEECFHPNEKVDLIFHLGEYSRIATSFEDARQLFKSNSYGTFCVLEAARKSEAKLIYAGSSSIFSDPELSPYAFLKNQNQYLLETYKKWYPKFKAITTYFYNVYGPGQIDSGRMATVIGIFQKAYAEGRLLPVVRPGTQQRDFTHINDIVDGLTKASLYGGPEEEFFLCSSRSYSIKEIASAFETKVQLVNEKPGERYYSSGDNLKTKVLLDWEPKHNVIEYIKEWLDLHATSKES